MGSSSGIQSLMRGMAAAAAKDSCIAVALASSLLTLCLFDAVDRQVHVSYT